MLNNVHLVGIKKVSDIMIFSVFLISFVSYPHHSAAYVQNNCHDNCLTSHKLLIYSVFLLCENIPTVSNSVYYIRLDYTNLDYLNLGHINITYP